MRSTFFGLEMGRRSLFTQQRALDVTGHNIANANTVGYTRQVADMAATLPYTVPAFNAPVTPLQVGTGVEITQIRRVREDFIDFQIRNENQSIGYWETKRDALKKIEIILREPTDNGLRNIMDKFWGSLQELSKNPESEGVRALVRETGVTLANTFNQLSDQLTNLQSDANISLGIKVDEANTMASQIDALNKQIRVLQTAGQNPNDLKDKRDLLLDKLSKIMDIQYSEAADGTVTVRVPANAAGNIFIDPITGVDPMISGSPVTWTSTGTAVTVNGGEMLALSEIANTITVAYLNDLNDMAGEFATHINTLHFAGFGLATPPGAPPTNNNFFAGGPPINAANIQVAASMSDLKNIAAATTGGTALFPSGVPGDGSNALAMAKLKHAPTMNGDTVTYDDFFRSLVSTLGVQSQEAGRMSDNQRYLLAQLENSRIEVSGVSLDEEMTNMVRFQQSYNAAARLVTTMDEMIDLVVNRMGLVGR